MAEPLTEEGGGTQKVLHCCGMGPNLGWEMPAKLDQEECGGTPCDLGKGPMFPDSLSSFLSSVGTTKASLAPPCSVASSELRCFNMHAVSGLLLVGDFFPIAES